MSLAAQKSPLCAGGDNNVLKTKGFAYAAASVAMISDSARVSVDNSLSSYDAQLADTDQPGMQSLGTPNRPSCMSFLRT